MNNDDFYDLLEDQVINVIETISNDPMLNLNTFKPEFKLSFECLEMFSPEEAFSNILYQLELDLEYNLAHYNIYTLDQQQALRFVYDLIQNYK